MTRQLISEFVRRPDSDRPPPATLDVLTSREREVLTLVARGWLLLREVAFRRLDDS